MQLVSTQVFTWMHGLLRLRQGGRFWIFFRKMLLCEQHFPEKKKSTMLPQAIVASIWSNVPFACPSRNAGRLPDLCSWFQLRCSPGCTACFASGRAEWDILFQENVTQRATFS